MSTPNMTHYPGHKWHVAPVPETLGWSKSNLSYITDYADSNGFIAGMVVSQGVILTSWGDITTPFTCRSIRKSLLSALYGIFIATNQIHLDWTLEALGIDDQEPSLTSQEKQATIANLLTSRSGVYHDSNYQTDAARSKLPQRGSHKPGTFWYYNNWDFNALGAVFEQCTKTGIFEEFERQIALPLQMEDYHLDNMAYLHGPFSRYPSYSFQLSARDLARFGLLYLRRGKWEEQQVIPQNWVQTSTSIHAKTSSGVGFGYMWWVCLDGKLFLNVPLPMGSYASYGFGGQYLLIIPAYDLVVVQRGNPDNPAYLPPTRQQTHHLLELILAARL